MSRRKRRRLPEVPAQTAQAAPRHLKVEKEETEKQHWDSMMCGVPGSMMRRSHSNYLDARLRAPSQTPRRPRQDDEVGFLLQGAMYVVESQQG